MLELACRKVARLKTMTRTILGQQCATNESRRSDALNHVSQLLLIGGSVFGYLTVEKPFIYVGVMELADMRDLGSRAFSVWVQIPPSTPYMA